MAFPVLPLLAKVGTAGAIIEGARMVGRGVRKATEGIPYVGKAVEVADTAGGELARVIDPIGIIHDDGPGVGGVIAGIVGGVSSVVGGALDTVGARLVVVQDPNIGDVMASHALRLAQEAEQRAAAAEKRAAEAERKARAAGKPIPRNVLSSRRWASLARRTAQEARASGNAAEAKRIAEQALAIAKASQNPPADSKAALADRSLTDAIKALAVTITDAINRKAEPNMADLVAEIRAQGGSVATRENPAAYADAEEAADADVDGLAWLVSDEGDEEDESSDVGGFAWGAAASADTGGHAHEHGADGEPCCDACAAKGPGVSCKTGACSAPSPWMLDGVTGGSDDSDEGDEEDGEIPFEAFSDPLGCTTCWAKKGIV